MIAGVVASLDGIWRADVQATDAWGTCFVALRDGMIGGADLSYYFTGDYTIDGDQLVITVVTRHYSGPERSLWGWRDGAELELRGTAHDKAMELSGHFVGEPTQGQTRVLLTKLAPWRPG